MDDKQDLVIREGNIMAFKYSNQIKGIETLMEIKTKRDEVTVRLSALYGYGSLVLYDLRVYQSGKPTASGIYLSEVNTRKVLSFMNDYLKVRQDVPDLVEQLGYDPFSEEA